MMHRRNFIKLIPAVEVMGYSIPLTGINLKGEQTLITDTREYWVSFLTKIANPLLNSLSNEVLRKNMPVECSPGNSENRKMVTYLKNSLLVRLEVFCRLLFKK